jgi:ADP-ribosylglycohydrolase
MSKTTEFRLFDIRCTLTDDTVLTVALADSILSGAVSCQGSVPEVITAFLESESYEDAVRKAVSLGGDSDTIACITGGIAHGVLRRRAGGDPVGCLPALDPKLTDATRRFCDAYNCA